MLSLSSLFVLLYEKKNERIEACSGPRRRTITKFQLTQFVGLLASDKAEYVKENISKAVPETIIRCHWNS